MSSSGNGLWVTSIASSEWVPSGLISPLPALLPTYVLLNMMRLTVMQMKKITEVYRAFRKYSQGFTFFPALKKWKKMYSFLSSCTPDYTRKWWYTGISRFSSILWWRTFCNNYSLVFRMWWQDWHTNLCLSAASIITLCGNSQATSGWVGSVGP